jgi:hypothetical protein
MCSHLLSRTTKYPGWENSLLGLIKFARDRFLIAPDEIWSDNCKICATEYEIKFCGRHREEMKLRLTAYYDLGDGRSPLEPLWGYSGHYPMKPRDDYYVWQGKLDGIKRILNGDLSPQSPKSVLYGDMSRDIWYDKNMKLRSPSC